MAESYLDLCVPPLPEDNKVWRKWKCNIWGKKCKWGVNYYRHGQATRRYNRCLKTSSWGRPSVNASGEFCYKKKGKKNKGQEICAKFDVSSNTLGKPHLVHTDPSSVPGSVNQAGLGQDKGSAMEALAKLDKRILIGAAIALVLIAR